MWEIVTRVKKPINISGDGRKYYAENLIAQNEDTTHFAFYQMVFI